MRQYRIAVREDLGKTLEANARALGMSAEKFIGAILNRYVLSPHTIQEDSLKKGYEEWGDVNLDWANL